MALRLQHGDRIIGDHVGRVGNLDPRHLLCDSRRYVGHIDNPRISLAKLHFGDDAFHVVLVRDDVVQHVLRVVRREAAGATELRQGDPGIETGRHALIGEHQLDAAAGKVLQPRDVRGIGDRHDRDQPVVCEDWLLAAGQAAVAHHGHPVIVGRGKDVGRGALLDLQGKLLRPGVVDVDVQVGHPVPQRVGELVECAGERGGGEDGEVRLPQRRRRERQECDATTERAQCAVDQRHRVPPRSRSSSETIPDTVVSATRSDRVAGSIRPCRFG